MNGCTNADLQDSIDSRLLGWLGSVQQSWLSYDPGCWANIYDLLGHWIDNILIKFLMHFCAMVVQPPKWSRNAGFERFNLGNGQLVRIVVGVLRTGPRGHVIIDTFNWADFPYRVISARGNTFVSIDSSNYWVIIIRIMFSRKRCSFSSPKLTTKNLHCCSPDVVKVSQFFPRLESNKERWSPLHARLSNLERSVNVHREARDLHSNLRTNAHHKQFIISCSPHNHWHPLA